NQTGPAERAIFVMWKLRGGEPMIHARVHAYIPCDGTMTRYSLVTGAKSPDGDLELTFTRNPIQIVRGTPFYWKATVEFPNGGGLIAVNDTYPYEAPADGYESKLVIEMPTQMKSWNAGFVHSYYFRSGDVYGRMTISIQADFQPPPTSFDAE